MAIGLLNHILIGTKLHIIKNMINHLFKVVVVVWGEFLMQTGGLIGLNQDL